MKTNEMITDEKYTAIGKLYGSEDIATEGSQTSARWARDVDGLGPYGFGPEALERFEALRGDHSVARDARPEAIALKAKTIKAVKKTIDDAKSWTNKVVTLLGTLARHDSDIAERLKTAAPDDESKLAGSIGALNTILTEVADGLPPSARAADRIAEAPGLKERLEQGPGTASTAKAAPIADTAAIDLLDGKLYVAIKDLNNAGRQAIREGVITANLSEYRFNVLRKK